MKRKITLFCLSLLSAALIGCGSSDNNDTTSSNSSTTLDTGYYIDSPVEGITYICGDQKGITNKEGEFKFTENSDCVFKIGNIAIKEMPGSILKNNSVIIEDNLTIARFLQSLDSDNNLSNGINIDNKIQKALKNYSHLYYLF